VPNDLTSDSLQPAHPSQQSIEESERDRRSERFWNAQVADSRYQGEDGPGMLISSSAIASLRRQQEETIVAKLLPLDRSLRVLDVGCGTGRWSYWFGAQVKEVVGIDFSEAMIARCRERLESKSLSNVTFYHRNAWDFTDLGQFDFIFAGGVLQCLTDEQLQFFVRSASSVLSPGQYCLTRDSVLSRRFDQSGDYPVHYRTSLEYESGFHSAGLNRVADHRAFLFPQLVSKLPPWLPLRGKWLEHAVQVDGFVFTHPPVSWLLPVYQKLTGRGIGAVPDHRFFLYQKAG
jgi:2-polyprenyl-3-methyl-5-hydroxy-6-metoxy-1,4-benzoquinol methylase